MEDYEQHETAYQRLIANGFVGWDCKKSFDELLAFAYRNDLDGPLALFGVYRKR